MKKLLLLVVLVLCLAPTAQAQTNNGPQGVEAVYSQQQGGGTCSNSRYPIFQVWAHWAHASTHISCTSSKGTAWVRCETWLEKQGHPWLPHVIDTGTLSCGSNSQTNVYIPDYGAGNYTSWHRYTWTAKPGYTFKPVNWFDPGGIGCHYENGGQSLVCYKRHGVWYWLS